MSTTPVRSIAIVGLGPRGLSVLERLLVRLRRRPPDGSVVIWAVDPVEHGPGRVWRSDQPAWLTMNATASEVSVRSPDSYLSGPGFARPDSLSDWTDTAAFGGPSFGPVDYPPRRVYGEYLRDVFHRLCAGAPPGVQIEAVLGEATALERESGGMHLTIDHGADVLPVDKVVLATGHGPERPLRAGGRGPRDSGDQAQLLRHAARHEGCIYVGEGMVAEMRLDAVAPGDHVAIRGLGLTFYDLVRSFSVGRGGRFVRTAAGALRYRPSGHEPCVLAGSRGGLPFRARARMTEPPETAPHPVVLTDGAIARLRVRATTARGSPKLDFAREVEPLIQAEVEHAYYRCAVRQCAGEETAERFSADFLARLAAGGPGATHEAVSRLRLGDLPGITLSALGRPFADEYFDRPAVFRDRLLQILRADVAESRKGTRESPLKAALEVLRQIRPILPAIVDFGGLLPASHEDFVRRFEPLSYVLSAGPEDTDVEQLVALIEAGVVEVVGPEATFVADDKTGGFAVESPSVSGSRRTARAMIEARAPGGGIGPATSPLLRQMVSDRMISEYVNTDPITGERFETGGLDVTREPFHVVDGQGRPDPDLYAIGVATDGARWFTQVGTGRPGKDSPFCRDADAIAADILARGDAPAPEVEKVG